MEDVALIKLQIQNSIAPQKESWPAPDFSGVTLGGDGKKPSMGGGGDLHWSLHDCVGWSREHCLKTRAQISAINGDRTLSAAGKAEKKKEIGTAALNKLAASQRLAKARAAVEAQNARWEAELGLHPKVPEAVADLMLLAEIRKKISATKEHGRVGFVLKHADDPRVVASVLTAPSFLSGLSEIEVEALKVQIAKRNNPDLVKVRDDTMRALADAERGVRAAASQIREAADLEGMFDGTAE